MSNTTFLSNAPGAVFSASADGAQTPAAEASATPRLDGVKVMVDAYNLEMAHGTGIKTYGKTLVSALGKLGADVSLLYSRPVGRSSSPLINELIFRDALGADRLAPRSDAGLLWRSMKSVMGMSERMIEVPWSGHIKTKRQPYEIGRRQYSSSRCFQDAIDIHYRLGREMTLKAPEKFDILHCTYPLPVHVKKARRITTVHDVIPIILPHLSLDHKDEVFLRHKKTIDTSDLIVTVSEASRRDILELFDVPEEKVCVTYQPIDITDVSEDEAAMVEATLNLLKLEPHKYILFVGAIEPKKNVRSLIDAYAKLETDQKLVIVGKKAWMWEQQVGHIESTFGPKWPQRIKLLDYLSYNSVRYLLKFASCFVFPSLYEGFGLPPLEAMTLGTPVITSNTSSLPEVCGDAALYVDPEDITSLISQMERVLSSEELRRSMSEAGRRQAAKFSVENYHTRLSAAYEKVLGA